MSKVAFEEIRVLVSISYNHTLSYDQEKKLLDILDEVNIEGFSASEQQYQGCGAMPYGFIIFQGDKYPTEANKQEMKHAVRYAIHKVKITCNT